MNRRLAAVRSLVKLARVLGLVPWSIEIGSVKAAPCRDTRGPGREAVIQMVDHLAGKSDPKSVRDLAILRLLYDLGLRRGEVVGLDLEDFRPDRWALYIMGKGRSGKEPMTLPETTVRALESWLNHRGNDPGPLFWNFDISKKGSKRLTGNGLYKMIRKLGKESGVETRPHGIRHTAVTEAVKAAQKNGIGIEEVLDFSRHKSLATLLIYRDRERNVQGRLSSLISQD